ncbi:MAG: exonuclease SbcCD subunit D [Parashewanella sp.]
MKFIHTSDWHIGRQLHNHSLLDDQIYVFQQIIELAAKHQVDAVIIAGDIYDRSVPPSSAITVLDDVLHQLINRLNIAVIMIAGNHDSHERLGFAAKHMKQNGLHIVGPLTHDLEVIKLEGKTGTAVFYPIPYAEPARVRQVFKCDATTHEQAMSVLLEQVHKDDTHDLPKVVISHCFLDGSSDSESERPLSIGGADKISPELFMPFDYVALGHLHGPQFKGDGHVRYSGSPLKYSFSEAKHNKSVTLVEFNQAADKPKIELLPLASKRNVRVIEGYLEQILTDAKADANDQDYIMVRLLDKHAILDAMGKLRSAYPNVLHLERTGLMAESKHSEIRKQHIKQNEMDMFSSFFSQTTGEVLTPQQTQAMTALLDSLHKQKEN